jgi:hypothetical protein
MKNINDIKILLKSFLDIQQQVLKQQELDLKRMIQEIKFQKEYMQVITEEIEKPIKLIGPSEAEEIEKIIEETLTGNYMIDIKPSGSPDSECKNIIQFPSESSIKKK